MSNPLNPASIYQETRPTDWLPMPEPKDDEIYLLVNAENSVPIGLPFLVSCDGEYLVEIGTVQDKEFLPSASKRFQSGEESNILPTLQSDSTMKIRQAILKISGNHLSELEFLGHDNDDNCEIVEIRSRLPACRGLSCKDLYHLRYFTLEGKNKIEDMSWMFFACYALKTIPELDTSKAINMEYMFFDCHALETIPELDTQNVADMSAMFWGCHKLKKVPMLNTQNVLNMYAMFFNCFSLKEVPKLNVRRVKDMNHIFDERPDIQKIWDLF